MIMGLSKEGFNSHAGFRRDRLIWVGDSVTPADLWRTTAGTGPNSLRPVLPEWDVVAAVDDDNDEWELEDEQGPD